MFCDVKSISVREVSTLAYRILTPRDDANRTEFYLLKLLSSLTLVQDKVAHS